MKSEQRYRSNWILFAMLLALQVVAIGLKVFGQPVYTPSDYRFQHFNMTDGLASEFANSIAQDSLGFIWILHGNGLSRYDGYTFKMYQYDPNDIMGMGPPSDGFLKIDRSGDLWLISNQNTRADSEIIMTRYDRQKDGFVKYQLDLQGAFGRSFCFDRNNTTIWIGTWGRGLYSFNISTGETTAYLNFFGDSVMDLERNSSMQQMNNISAINDRDSVLLVATMRGLWQFDKATKTFTHPICNSADSAILYNAPVVSIIESRNSNDFYFVIDKGWEGQSVVGLIRVANNLSEKSTILLNDWRFGNFDQDKDGIFWLTTNNEGLCKFNPADRSLAAISSNMEDPYSLRSNTLTDVTVDRDQNIWVGTWDRGISKLPRQSLRFYNYNFDKLITGHTIYGAKEKSYLVISQLRSLNAGDNELLSTELEATAVGNLSFDKLKIDYSIKGMVTMLATGKKHLWIGTNGAGSEAVVGLPMNPLSGLVESGPAHIIGHEPQNPNTIGENVQGSSFFSTSGLWEDEDRNLWVAGRSIGNGLNKVRLSKPYGVQGSVERFQHIAGDSSTLSNRIIWWEMYPEEKNAFWLITASGLDLFRNGSFEHYFKNEYVMTVKRDSKGLLLVGTTNGLYEGIPGKRYKFRKDTTKHLSLCYAFEEDKFGRLWISSQRSVQCYDRERNVVVHFGVEEGLGFALDWVLKSSDGIFAMGDLKGITVFDPNTFRIDETPTLPVLTSLTVSNQPSRIKNANSKTDGFSIAKNISVLTELTIDYRHNNFAIEFSAMEMTAPQKNVYRHKLEGYDDDWIETDFRNRTATYTNLDAGDYTFRVKASNHHGIWSDNERTLKIRILPPPWKTNWAYAGYGIIFLGLLYMIRKNIVQRERLKSNLKLAKVEQEKEHFELEKAKEVDKVKSTFFANISHEFRTPLTLIKGPVQEMMEEFADHPKVQERMKLVQRNADLVLKLINQLLDLAKLESGTLPVDKSQNDLNTFLRVVMGSFSSLAYQKNITLETEFPHERLAVSFDKGKVETILINLINNAIKFTPAGGTVAVRTELKNLQLNKDAHSAGAPLWRRGVGGEVKITVSDTGIGIDKDQHEKIFERFHQVSDAHKEVGTGIGLSLVKELVALMNGTLSLKSEPGKGSEFTVMLPVEVSQQITTVEEIKEFETQRIPEELRHALNETLEEPQGTRPRILVVEDNSDLRKFIIGSLGKEFEFLEAADGKQGLQIAFDETPDLIISDIMMPEMDGITMTGKLKKDTRTSHIPLILLTAKTSDESKLSGLSTGADDYLTKPFNKQELLLKVRNSIALQVKFREKVRLELLKESPKVEVQSADEKFLLKVKEAILARLSDEQLSVESLAEEIALSRSQLLRKITALTGVSVNELIRTFRLQKAAQLLEQNWGPVTQVAYEVGFSNLSYFSKVFKEQYGVLPSEYSERVT